MTDPLPEALRKLVAELQTRGFMISHEGLDGDDAAVVLELSDGLVAGGKVILARWSDAWEVAIEVGDRIFWPSYTVWQAMRGQVSDQPPQAEQPAEERRRLTLEVIDRLHGDRTAQQAVLDATRRWTQPRPGAGVSHPLPDWARSGSGCDEPLQRSFACCTTLCERSR